MLILARSLQARRWLCTGGALMIRSRASSISISAAATAAAAAAAISASSSRCDAACEAAVFPASPLRSAAVSAASKGPAARAAVGGIRTEFRATPRHVRASTSAASADGFFAQEIIGRFSRENEFSRPVFPMCLNPFSLYVSTRSPHMSQRSGSQFARTLRWSRRRWWWLRIGSRVCSATFPSPCASGSGAAASRSI